MAAKTRVPMPRSQRAKQFAPFAALVGFDLALEMVREKHRMELENEIERFPEPEKVKDISTEEAEELRQIDPNIENDPMYWIA